MRTYKTIAAVALALGLSVLVTGAAMAHGRQGSGPDTCPQGQATCTQEPNGGGRGGPARPGNPAGRGAANGPQAGNWEAMLPPAVEGEVPSAVVEAMEAGIADEYHAAAVYEAVIDQFGAVRPFTNILRAEEQHAAAWAFLFERYELAAPAAPATVEVPDFATLSDACTAAAAAEEANMALYDKMLAAVEGYPDITQVVTALRDASAQNHLPAFERCAGK